MTDTKFDPCWPHGHLLNGYKARFLTDGIKGDYPFAFAVELPSASEALYVVARDGKTALGSYVKNAPAPKIVRYVNIYPEHDHDNPMPHVTRESADRGAMRSRIGCNRIELEPGRWDE